MGHTPALGSPEHPLVSLGCWVQGAPQSDLCAPGGWAECGWLERWVDGRTPGTPGPGDGLGERLASGLELGWWVSGRGLPISASALAWSPLLTSSPEQPEITWGKHPSLGKHICFASLGLLGPSRAESRRLEKTKVLGRNPCGVEEWVPPAPPHPQPPACLLSLRG